MAKEFAKAFYNSSAWLRCKDSYIAERITKDGGMCEQCHKQLGYIVHHKTILTENNIHDPDIALNHVNLMYVCKDCHDQFEGHGVGKKTKPLFTFDENGQPISLRDIDSPLQNF